jgi:hypothetical protein
MNVDKLVKPEDRTEAQCLMDFCSFALQQMKIAKTNDNTERFNWWHKEHGRANHEFYELKRKKEEENNLVGVVQRLRSLGYNVTSIERVLFSESKD